MLSVMTRLIIGFICLFTVVFSLPSSAPAVMVGLSTEELTKGSEAVIIGQVEGVESFWSGDGSTIFTRATVVLENAVTGEVLKERLIVEYEGGEVGDMGLKISDTAPLKKGERVVLFLKSGKSKKYSEDNRQRVSDGNGENIRVEKTAEDYHVFNIVGLAQGKYTINKDGIAQKSGYSIAKDKGVIDNNIPLHELIDRIRGVK